MDSWPYIELYINIGLSLAISSHILQINIDGTLNNFLLSTKGDYRAPESLKMRNRLELGIKEEWE